MDPHQLRNGRQELDQAGNAFQASGLELLLRGRSRKFGAGQWETPVSSMIEVLTLWCPQKEPIDDCLGRFEPIRQRTQDLGDFPMGVGGFTRMLLRWVGVRQVRWPLLM